MPPTAVPKMRSTPLETVVSTFSDSTTATWGVQNTISATGRQIMHQCCPRRPPHCTSACQQLKSTQHGAVLCAKGCLMSLSTNFQDWWKAVMSKALGWRAPTVVMPYSGRQLRKPTL